MPDAVWVTPPVDYNRVVGERLMHCATCGSSVGTRNRVQHENFHKTFSHRREEDMSRVNWCDYGNHAFKRGEEGSASFSGTEYKDGVPIATQMDACREHNPLNASRLGAQYSISGEMHDELTKPE